MSVYWYCDRCNQKATDKGVRYSKMPDGWRAFYLAEAVEKPNDRDDFIATLNLCEHCSKVSEKTMPQIQFEKVRTT